MSHAEGKRVHLTIGTAETERQLLDVIPVSGCEYQEAFQLLNLPAERAGLHILDVGAGVSDVTAQLLAEGADAYAIDPRYKSRSDLKGKAMLQVRHIKSHGATGATRSRLEADAIERCIESMKRNPERYRAEFASQLSFPDNFFDYVISLNAITGYLDVDFSLLQRVTEECLRVTKPGGSIQLAPFNPEKNIGFGQGIYEARSKSLGTYIAWLQAGNVSGFVIKETPRQEYSRLEITK